MQVDQRSTHAGPAVQLLDDVPERGLRPTASGWYREPGTPGVLRYWNGLRWEDWRKPVVETAAVDRGVKTVGVAYLLVAFLGGLGVHDFYLGRTVPGVAKLLMWFVGMLLGFTGFGFVLLAAVTIWAIVDLFHVPAYVNAANLRDDRASA